jgi:hypothetical protein
VILLPITLKRANAIVVAWHRHNKPVRGCRWCLAAEHNGKIVGIVIVARPVAGGIDQDLTAEVRRLCVIPDAPHNTCSFLYAAARRVWQTMGGSRMLTYTLQSESGASLRGAGWNPSVVKVKHKCGNGWQSRPRQFQPVFEEPKFRWDAPILGGHGEARPNS